MRPITLIFILIFSLHAQGGAEKCRVVMGMLNAQNFVKPVPGAPGTSMPVNEKDVKNKTRNLAKAIGTLNNQKGPDFLGMAEVGSLEHLQGLIKDKSLKKLGYNIVAISDDVPMPGKPQENPRVIKVGFITKLKMLQEPVSHIYWSNNDPLWTRSTTRPILETVLEAPNKEKIIVFVNHWPSKLRGEWSLIRRYQAAVFLRERVRKILKVDPSANILVVGDFNTPPWSPEMQGGLGVQWHKDDSSLSQPDLINLNHTLGSYFDEIKDFGSGVAERTPEEWDKFYGALGKKYGTYFSDSEVWMNFATEIETFKRKHPMADLKEVNQFYVSLAKRYVANYAEKPRSDWDIFDQILVSKNMYKKFVTGSYGPVHKVPFINDEGRPNEFNRETGKGVSDHVPVLGVFEF